MNSSKKDSYKVEVTTHITGPSLYKGKRFYIVTEKV